MVRRDIATVAKKGKALNAVCYVETGVIVSMGLFRSLRMYVYAIPMYESLEG